MKRKTAENAATHYTNYLIKYIKDNSDDYTCYSCDGLTDLIEDTNSSGVALDNDKFTKLSESDEILNKENG